MLNTIEYGTPGDTPSLLVAHGLFGSARNWNVIAKRLSGARHVVAVDMRNHGDSDWAEPHHYPEMAGDLAQVIQSLPGSRADVLGHSMGGKAAMMLALTQPEHVARLIVADIAPVPYAHTQAHVIEALQAVDLSQVTSRADAAAQLDTDPAIVPFLLQSLDMAKKQWRLNLDVLARDMAQIIGFPQVEGMFEGDTLFLTGQTSDYVTRDHRPRIKTLFPKARFAKLKDAGHWLHAEQPRAFEQVCRQFLGDPS